MCHRTYYDHTDPLFQELDVLKVPQINYYTKSNFIYKSLNSFNLCNWFEYYHSEYGTRNANSRVLLQHVSKTEHSKRSLMYDGLEFRNALSRDIRESINYDTFKCKIKHHILLTVQI